MAKAIDQDEIVCIRRKDLCTKCAKAVERNVIDPPVLTPVQLAILKFIVAYVEKNGFAPAMNEFEVNGHRIRNVTAFEHISNLIEKGYVRSEKYKARSIRLVPWVEAWVMQQMEKQTAMVGG